MSFGASNYHRPTAILCAWYALRLEVVMMDPFVAQMIARKEDELMAESIARVSEEEGYVRDSQPGWTRRHVANLLKSAGNALASIGEHMNQQQDGTRSSPLSDNR